MTRAILIPSCRTSNHEDAVLSSAVGHQIGHVGAVEVRVYGSTNKMWRCDVS